MHKTKMYAKKPTSKQKSKSVLNLIHIFNTSEKYIKFFDRV